MASVQILSCFVILALTPATHPGSLKCPPRVAYKLVLSQNVPKGSGHPWGPRLFPLVLKGKGVPPQESLARASGESCPRGLEQLQPLPAS